MTKLVQLERDEALAWITIDRPDALNALNEEVLLGILEHLDLLAQDEAVKVVCLTGAGEKSFVAGADIAVMAEYKGKQIADYLELGGRVMRRIETLPVPVIALVNGFALGGGLELALACDLIYASEIAKVGQPEVNLGILPGFGGTQRLVGRCGVGTARRLVYTGEIIDAAEALRLHVVDGVFAPQDLRSEVEEVAKTIAAKAPLAIRKSKSVINAYSNQQLLSGLREEVEAFLEVFDSEDRKEGMKAFLEKRAAMFVGK